MPEQDVLGDAQIQVLLFIDHPGRGRAIRIDNDRRDQSHARFTGRQNLPEGVRIPKFQIGICQKNPLNALLLKPLDANIIALGVAQIFAGIHYRHGFLTVKRPAKPLRGLVSRAVLHNDNPGTDVFLFQQAGNAFDGLRIVYIIQNNNANIVHTFPHASPISLRYRPNASRQSGRGVKPLLLSLDLSSRLLKGRLALFRPYSSVVTGMTLVVFPA